jgi:hypothetical protein
MRGAGQQSYTPILPALPAGLQVLRVDNVLCITQANTAAYPARFHLPQQLEVLHIKHLHSWLGVLPDHLRVLHIESMTFNEPLGLLGLLPPALEELDLSHAASFQQPLGVLPRTLKSIRLNSEYTQALKGVPVGATVQYIRTN